MDLDHTQLSRIEHAFAKLSAQEEVETIDEMDQDPYSYFAGSNPDYARTIAEAIWDGLDVRSDVYLDTDVTTDEETTGVIVTAFVSNPGERQPIGSYFSFDASYMNEGREAWTEIATGIDDLVIYCLRSYEALRAADR